VVLEKDLEDDLDKSWKKWSVTLGQREEEYPTNNKEGKLTVLVTLRRNGLLSHVIEGREGER
jgi:hypothetical protein